MDEFDVALRRAFEPIFGLTQIVCDGSIAEGSTA